MISKFMLNAYMQPNPDATKESLFDFGIGNEIIGIPNRLFVVGMFGRHWRYWIGFGHIACDKGDISCGDFRIFFILNSNADAHTMNYRQLIQKRTHCFVVIFFAVVVLLFNSVLHNCLTYICKGYFTGMLETHDCLNTCSFPGGPG